MVNEWVMQETGKTHELLSRAFQLLLGLGDVPLLPGLGGMEPAADAQPLAAVLGLTDDDLLDGVEAVAGLDLEEDELVPDGRDALRGDGERLGEALGAGLDGVELERAAPLGLPALVVREGHVEDVGHAAGADHVVVVEEVAALAVADDGHVLLGARERAAAGDGAEEGTEGRGIDSITEFEEIGEQSDLIFCEIVQGG